MLESLQIRYNNTSQFKYTTRQTFAEAKNLISNQGYEIILNRLAIELAYTSSFLLSGSNCHNYQSRYLIAFEIIKEISRLSNNLHLSMNIVKTGKITNEIYAEVSSDDTQNSAEDVDVSIIYILYTCVHILYCILCQLLLCAHIRLFLYLCFSPRSSMFTLRRRRRERRRRRKGVMWVMGVRLRLSGHLNPKTNLSSLYIKAKTTTTPTDTHLYELL